MNPVCIMIPARHQVYSCSRVELMSKQDCCHNANNTCFLNKNNNSHYRPRIEFDSLSSICILRTVPQR